MTGVSPSNHYHICPTLVVSPGGFLKLNSDEIKPITITTPTIMLSGHGSGGLGKATNQITGRGANEKGGDGSAENHDAHHENPFLQFLSPSWYVLNFQPLFLLFRTLLSVDVLCICTTFLW